MKFLCNNFDVSTMNRGRERERESECINTLEGKIDGGFVLTLLLATFTNSMIDSF